MSGLDTLASTVERRVLTVRVILIRIAASHLAEADH